MSMLSILIITEQLNNLTVCFLLFPGFLKDIVSKKAWFSLASYILICSLYLLFKCHLVAVTFPDKCICFCCLVFQKHS